MTSSALILRWSWRDLRAHWAKVLAIALVIAIGTGGYAGLTSNANWRRASYAASYGALGMYDLRVDLAAGGYVAEGALADVLGSIDHAAWISAVEERLLVSTQLDASHEGITVLVRSEITGSDFSQGGPDVNGYHAFEGRLVDDSDAGEMNVMVERSFANFYDLAPSGTVEITGNRTLHYVGQATTPEYFAVAPEGEIYASEANFGALFTTLETAQLLAGRTGEVNNAVLTLVPDGDRDLVQAEIEAALVAVGIGGTVASRDDNTAYSTLTNDVENDQQVFNVVAFLLFAGAVGAAFNLIHRLAEQQRREIGISMALGITPRRIAIRPFLVSAQIALVGVVLGIGVGILIGYGFQSVFEAFVPLPVWETSFQFGAFAGAAAIGFLVPFAATTFPIAKAVRVTPVDAIRPPHVGTKASKARRRRSLHADTFTVMPFRNLRRAKRRTLLTILGIAAVITVLVAILGIIDSLLGTLDAAEREAVGANEYRVTVTFDGFYASSSPELQALASAESVASTQEALRVGATLASEGDAFDVLLELIDLETGAWTPTLLEGGIEAGPGLIVAEKAADDLDVAPGDTISVRLPVRISATSFVFEVRELPVLGVHASPIRSTAYLDQSHGDLLGLGGLSNLAYVDPAPGSSVGDVQRELFESSSVASVQSVASTMEAVRDQMGSVVGVFRVIIAAALVLALLIAFNTASINLDERAREHATMFAYGIRVRTALRMAATETLVIGVLATTLGLLAGLALLTWMTQDLLTTTLPDIGLDVVLEPATIATVLVLGVVAVAIAPVFTVRRMRRMDLPGMLRLVE